MGRKGGFLLTSEEVILTFLKSHRSDVCHTRTYIYFSLEVEELEDMGDV
jgi:hypothetical protein